MPQNRRRFGKEEDALNRIRIQSRILTALLLALAFLLCACTSLQENAPDTPAAPLSLWALRDDPMTETLYALTVLYNAEDPEAPVSVRIYDDEQSLANAMDSARPDLLLCGQDHALALYGQGRLKRISDEDAPLPQFTETFLALSDCVGVSYFPLGADVQLLAVNPSVPTQTDAAVLSNMDRLCRAASDKGKQEGQAFFSADSFAGLFAACMAQTNEVFLARRQEDIRSEAYRRLYNLLADAAYTGGLTYDSADPVGDVASGTLSCALSRSSALVGADPSLFFYPMPVMQGGSKLCLAEIYGLAVTSPFDRNLPYVGDFLRGLFAQETSLTSVLDAGFLPACDAPWPEGGGSFIGALRATADYYRFLSPDAAEGYRLRGRDFEADFRDALALLQ